MELGERWIQGLSLREQEYIETPTKYCRGPHPGGASA